MWANCRYVSKCGCVCVCVSGSGGVEEEGGFAGCACTLCAACVRGHVLGYVPDRPRARVVCGCGTACVCARARARVCVSTDRRHTRRIVQRRHSGLAPHKAREQVAQYHRALGRVSGALQLIAFRERVCEQRIEGRGVPDGPARLHASGGCEC